MRFDLTNAQAAWQLNGATIGTELPVDATARDAVQAAARHGLLEPEADLLSLTAAIEAVGHASPSAAVSIAMHLTVITALRGDARFADALLRGDVIGAIALSADDVPVEKDGHLSGRASWVAPIESPGIALLGARTGDDVAAYAVALDADGVLVEPEKSAGLHGLVCGHVVLRDAQAMPAGETMPSMARVRLLMAAVGLGIGRRALFEALTAARQSGGADAGEQTVQGLLADAATELEAARLLTGEAARRDGQLTLGEASIAKLASTGAAERAVERATQVIGVTTLRRGHIVERLAQDVRALELFAGRTEALRAAVAAEILPQVG